MTDKPQIIFIDCTETDYNPSTIKNNPVGGIQHATASLSTELASLGYNVTVINNTSAGGTYDGVYWQSLSSGLPIIKKPKNTILIANNDPALFQPFCSVIKDGAKTVIWSHNTLNFKRFKRNSRWKSYLKLRPHAVFLSNDALSRTPFYYPFSSKTVIPHFLDSSIYGTRLPEPKTTLGHPPKVIFTSQPHRGLKKSTSLWQQKINKARPDAEFHIFCNKFSALELLEQSEEDLQKTNIILQPRCSRDELFEKMSFARAMFYPGSKDETFCFVAAEAHALGVPVVTQGIGSLKDRVQHNQNGFVTSNDNDFCNALLETLNNDDLWQKLRNNALRDAQSYQAGAILPLWEELFLTLTASK